MCKPYRRVEELQSILSTLSQYFEVPQNEICILEEGSLYDVKGEVYMITSEREIPIAKTNETIQLSGGLKARRMEW